jgi:hypothetical protein
VLDDDEGVAEDPQPDQRLDESRLSRWCSPMDGSSSTYRTPTRPDPIWVASRMRCASPPDRVAARAGQRQVVQAHVEQELQPLVDLLDDPLTDLVRHVEVGQEFSSLGNREVTDLGDVLGTKLRGLDGHGQNDGLEARASTN